MAFNLIIAVVAFKSWVWVPHGVVRRETTVRAHPNALAGMSTAGTTVQLFFPASSDGLTAENLKGDDDSLPTPTPSECSDYWDPPCRVCKKVDNEANVLCDICNGAYHLDCIANIKPPLPRQPEDDEWFCRSCIKRGIPESIIDRVGRRTLPHT